MSASPKLRDVDDREHVISRTFDAPRELVWKAWTEPQRMAQWWGPNCFTNPVCDLDVRPGGAYRIVMRSPDGVDYPLKGIYRDVVPPKLLVYTVDISDHPEDWHGLLKKNLKGNAADTSKPVLHNVSFEAEGPKTRVTIRQSFASVALRDAFVKMGMEQGWGQSLDRLANALQAA
jgi:uncharacterized protein YndB with AHSA1/START domain